MILFAPIFLLFFDIFFLKNLHTIYLLGTVSISILLICSFDFLTLICLAAKMLYTRSCAVNSVVGHLLGIGDRHTHNILIHQNSGEVVHIDFGIVFEQGKVSQVFNLNAHQG